MAASTQEEPNDDGASASGANAADASVADDASEASVRSASTADADGSAGGTTVKIVVYRSSYQLAWDLNDEHGVESLMATWANGTREAPDWWQAIQGSPGSQVDCPSEYSRDAEPKRTGYAFLGWSTDPAAPKGQMLDELAIPEDAEIAGEGDERTIALYAIWTPIEYSVVFDLTKNPEDASAVPSFSWTTGKGEFTDLGGGRYRLHGITLDDYDPATGLIEIATPSRGSGGYRFLSWAEPESQQDPSVAMRRSGTSKWFVNPVALPHYDYEPVLTARWGLSFDVDVPSQITFDEYDSLEIEGSLTDSTSKEDVDEESPDEHDRGKQAHFCSQSTATDYRIVGLESVRAASADDVLTTSDSSKATHDEVLGSERLLSMFAATDKSESAGVHFRLDDAVDMDSARYSSFVIPRQQAGFDPSATDRDAESRLYVSYRLNLDNKVDGASEPNHGLVAAANVADGVRTRIASVSYEFAVADHEVENGIPEDPLCLWTEDDDGTIMDVNAIKAAANQVRANDAAAVSKYTRWMTEDHRFYLKWYDQGMSEAEGALLEKAYSTYEVRLIGINHDRIAGDYGTGTAGFTFQFVDMLKDKYRMNGSATNEGGWPASELRARMRSGIANVASGTDDNAIWDQIPLGLRKVMAYVSKSTVSSSSASGGSPTYEYLFLASYAEMTSTNHPPAGNKHYPLLDEGSTYAYYKQFNTNGSSGSNSEPALVKKRLGSADFWWERSMCIGDTDQFWVVSPTGGPMWNSGRANESTRGGVVPCFCL